MKKSSIKTYVYIVLITISIPILLNDQAYAMGDPDEMPHLSRSDARIDVTDRIVPPSASPTRLHKAALVRACFSFLLQSSLIERTQLPALVEAAFASPTTFQFPPACALSTGPFGFSDEDYLAMITRFLDAGIHANTINPEGTSHDTILICAARSGCIAAVERLIERGAHASATNRDGQTACDCALAARGWLPAERRKAIDDIIVCLARAMVTTDTDNDDAAVTYP